MKKFENVLESCVDFSVGNAVYFVSKMLENSRKRARKSKLEVREGMEFEDTSVLYMQVKKELEEKTNIDKPTTTVGDVAPNQTDSFHGIASTTAISHRPKMEFSVKVEVEECDIEDLDTGQTGKDDGGRKRKHDEEETSKNVTSGVVTVDTSTSSVFVPSNPSNTLSKSDTETKKEFKEYVTNKQMILRLAERLKKSLNIADKVLAIEARNYAGRVLEPQDEGMYQRVLREWNSWYDNHSGVRQPPLLYKCCVCGASYWHLHDFKEHVITHRHMKNYNQFKLTIETENDECYIVYYMIQLSKENLRFPKGNCFKCHNSAASHIFAKNDRKNYKCVACQVTFSTCTQLVFHEQRCAVFRNKYLTGDPTEYEQCRICEAGFYTKPSLMEHLRLFHTVRSDVVIAWELHSCKACTQSFVASEWHVCPKRSNNYGCNYCGRSLQRKVHKEVHVKRHHYPVKCRICGKQLPAACVEPSHLLQHTEKFALLYKCSECSDGCYYPDEESIVHHTEIVHKRKFERKFKYLEMVILPKQCLDIKREAPPLTSKPSDEIKKVSITKVTSGSVTSPLVPSLKDEPGIKEKMSLLVKELTEPLPYVKQEEVKDRESIQNVQYHTDVVIKDEPMDDTVQTESVPEPVDIKTEKDVHGSDIDVLNINSLNTLLNIKPKTEPSDAMDDEEPDEGSEVVVVENGNDVISITSAEDSYDSANSHSDKKYTGKKRKRLQRHVCSCGFVGIRRKMALHRQRCLAVLALRTLRRPRRARAVSDDISKTSSDSQKTTTIKQPAPKKTADPAESTSRDDSDNEDAGEKGDGEEVGEDGENAAGKMLNEAPSDGNKPQKKRRAGVMHTGKCGFRAQHTEMWRHRASCAECAPGTFLHRPAACTKCDNTYDTIHRYVKHLHKVHGYERNTCPFCSKTFDTLTRLESDVVSHVRRLFVKTNALLGGKGTACTQCHAAVHARDFFTHWESHMMSLMRAKEDDVEPAALVIDEAAEGLYSSDTIKRAVASLQSSEVSRLGRSKQRQCVVCEREFSRINDSKRHLIEHLLADAYTKKPYYRALRCQICAKQFLKADKYKHHLREHASLPLYQCELCSKSFSDSSNFSKHKKVHNLATLSCSLCNKKFHNKNYWMTHMKMHDTTKPTVCEICQRAFYAQSAYKKHMRAAHEKRRSRVRCLVCRDSFTRLRDKWDHMWIVHNERKFIADCQLCHLAFRRYADLKQHMRNDHKREIVRTMEGAIRLVCRSNVDQCECCPNIENSVTDRVRRLGIRPPNDAPTRTKRRGDTVVDGASGECAEPEEAAEALDVEADSDSAHSLLLVCEEDTEEQLDV